jgi:hypothetical protein
MTQTLSGINTKITLIVRYIVRYFLVGTMFSHWFRITLTNHNVQYIEASSLILFPGIQQSARISIMLEIFEWLSFPEINTPVMQSNPVEQSPSWRLLYSLSREIRSTLGMVHHRFHKSPPKASALSQRSPAHHYIILRCIHPVTHLRLGLPSYLFPSGFLRPNFFKLFLSLRYVLQNPPIPSSFLSFWFISVKYKPSFTWSSVKMKWIKKYSLWKISTENKMQNSLISTALIYTFFYMMHIQRNTTTTEKLCISTSLCTWSS